MSLRSQCLRALAKFDRTKREDDASACGESVDFVHPAFAPLSIVP
jgi:hypothetical protein